MRLIVHPKLKPVRMQSRPFARLGLHPSAISCRWSLVSNLTQVMAPGSLHAHRLEASILKLTGFKLAVQAPKQKADETEL